MAATGGDDVVAEFFAQVGDVDVEEIGEGELVFVEEVFVEGGAADDFAAMEHEVFEQGVFAGGEGNFFGVAGDAFGGGVELKIADSVGGAGLAGGATDEGAEAGEEFVEIEGFGEVVVGTLVEAFDAIGHGISGGEHEDGGGDAGAESGEDLPAVESGEHDVEDDGVVLMVGGFVESFLAVAGGVDGIVFFTQGGGEAALEEGVVFDDEEFHEGCGCGC